MPRQPNSINRNEQRAARSLGWRSQLVANADHLKGQGLSHHIYSLLGRYSLVLLLALLVIGFSIARPASFFTINNFQGIFINQVVVVFAAIGLIAPLIVGELDLSVGYVVGLSQALVVGLMTLQGLSPPLAIVITIVACALVGVVNGALVVKFGLNSLIVTLATGNVIYGLVLWYTGGTVLFENVPALFLKISSGTFLYVPLPIWYAVLLIAIVELILGYFPTGRRMYAVGGNRRAALLTGIAVDWLVIAAFTVSAIVCGLGGIIIASLVATELGPSPSLLLPHDWVRRSLNWGLPSCCRRLPPPFSAPRLFDRVAITRWALPSLSM